MSQNQSVSGIIQIVHEALNPIRSTREKKKKRKKEKSLNERMESGKLLAAVRLQDQVHRQEILPL
jgi:hypothetical protein